MKFVPRSYQNQAIQLGVSVPRLALMLDVGLGKSAVAATIMLNTLHTCEVDKWLIIAPKKVCQTTWPSEFAKWDHLHELKVLRLDSSTVGERRLKLRRLHLYDVVVINIDMIKWLIDELGEWPFDGVVIDESSKFKDPSTLRFRALRRVVGSISRLILMTGSPVAQGLLGLWPQMFLLDFGKRLGRTLSSYKQTFFQPVGYNGFTVEPKPGACEAIEEAIKDICLTMKAADHLDMPPVIENAIPVILPDAAMVIYKKMVRDMILELGDDPIIAVNAAVLSSKLSQIANGAAYSQSPDGDTRNRTVNHIHDAKLEALQDFLDERQGAPFLLAYHFQADKDRLRAKFGKSIEFFDASPQQLKRWKDQQIPILALQPQSAGHGVDQLQYGTCTVLWYGPPWSRELYDQVNGRVIGARQIGTPFEKQTGMVHILVAAATVDEGALTALTQRGYTQAVFLNSLRNRINEHLNEQLTNSKAG